jgi:hypothetical protein
VRFVGCVDGAGRDDGGDEQDDERKDEQDSPLSARPLGTHIIGEAT